MEPFKLKLLLTRAGEIREKAASFNRNDDFARLQHNLELASDYCGREEMRKPLIIAIVGGTGVGKSYIFSALCGVDGISPSSSSIRGFTRKLHISASEEERCFLPFSAEEAKFVDISLPGIVLIDTPDLDTIHAENARIARETLSVADIIVCVTTPDKRSDFVVNQNVVEWASRKRWFFAMNKADTADVVADKLRQDFISRLRTLGFEDCSKAVFVFSATDKENHEFANFRESIASARSLQSNRLLKQEACLRQILHAFNSERLIERLLKLLMDLKNSRDILIERLVAAETRIYQAENVYQATRQAFAAWSYSALCKRRSFFLFPWLLAGRWLNDEKENDYLENEVEQTFRKSTDLLNLFTDERRSIEDKALTMPEDSQATYSLHYFHNAGKAIIHQVRKNSELAVSSRLMRFYIFIANLLPVIVLFQTLYRMITSWLNATWLPTDFFVHAALITLAATLPGYLLISRGLTRIGDQMIPEAPALDSRLNLLDARINQIETILQLSSQLHSSADNELGRIRSILPESSYGISAGISQAEKDEFSRPAVKKTESADKPAA
jgi:ABC-type multidrug transport system fused ATPase/permease subunit